MPDSFDLFDEVGLLVTTTLRRKTLEKKSNRPKPKSGIVDISHWGDKVGSVEKILDPKYGPWEIVYATWQGTDVPISVSPALAEFIDREKIYLSLSPSRETGLMYVRGRFPVEGCKYRVRMALHRFVCGLPPPGKLPIELHVNHKTRMTLDNRRGNLEVVIPAVNLRMRSIVGTGISKYCGVSLYRGRLLQVKKGEKVYAETSKPYRVICWFGGRRTNVGLFATEEEAGRAYDKEVLQRLRRSVRMMRVMGTILPFEQVNRLLNFERSVEELEAYFRSAMRRASAQASAKQAVALMELRQTIALSEEEQIPF